MALAALLGDSVLGVAAVCCGTWVRFDIAD